MCTKTSLAHGQRESTSGREKCIRGPNYIDNDWSKAHLNNCPVWKCYVTVSKYAKRVLCCGEHRFPCEAVSGYQGYKSRQVPVEWKAGFPAAISVQARGEQSHGRAVWSFLHEAGSLEVGVGVGGGLGNSLGAEEGFPRTHGGDSGRTGTTVAFPRFSSIIRGTRGQSSYEAICLLWAELSPSASPEPHIRIFKPSPPRLRIWLYLETGPLTR